jgi:hypothetical protein
MSDLENKIAKPVLGPMILDGSQRVLSATDLGAVAVFAFKTAVVVDHMNPLRRSNFFTAMDTQKFKDNLTLPSWIQMWLAAFRSGFSPSAFMVSDYRKGRSASTRGYEIFFLTYAIGHFAFQVAAFRRTAVVRGPYSNPSLVQHPQWGSFALEFWPITGRSITWPPPEFLGDETIKEFSDRRLKIG